MKTRTRKQPLDYVTILMTRPGRRACKRFVRKGTVTVKEDYQAGWEFGVLEPFPVSNIMELSNLLLALEALQEMFVVRGAPYDTDLIGSWVRRKGSGQGDDFHGNLETPAAGRRYLEIDVDAYPLPDNQSMDDGAECISEYLIQQLPREFHEVCYHYQLSASAGMGNPKVVSMHLWFWLACPIPDQQLKAWAAEVNRATSIKLIDTALFQHVQVHYTAKPIFDGVDDPFPVRSGLVVKKNGEVALDLTNQAVTATVPRKKLPNAPPIARPPIAGSGFEFRLSQIGDHAGGSGFRSAVLRAAASYVATYGRDDTDPDELYGICATQCGQPTQATTHRKRSTTAQARP